MAPILPYRFVAYAILAPKLHRDHDDMGLEEAAYVIRAGTGRIVADGTEYKR